MGFIWRCYSGFCTCDALSSTSRPCYSFAYICGSSRLVLSLPSLWYSPPVLPSPSLPLPLLPPPFVLFPRHPLPGRSPSSPSLSSPLPPFPEATLATTGAPPTSSVAWFASPSPLPPTALLLRRPSQRPISESAPSLRAPTHPLLGSRRPALRYGPRSLPPAGSRGLLPSSRFPPLPHNLHLHVHSRSAPLVSIAANPREGGR